MNFRSSFLSPEKYRIVGLLIDFALLLFLHLFCWNLEPTVSRDELRYRFNIRETDAGICLG